MVDKVVLRMVLCRGSGRGNVEEAAVGIDHRRLDFDRTIRILGVGIQRY